MCMLSAGARQYSDVLLIKVVVCVYAVTYEIALGFPLSPKKDDRKNEGAAGRKGLRRGGRRKARGFEDVFQRQLLPPFWA